MKKILIFTGLAVLLVGLWPARGDVALLVGLIDEWAAAGAHESIVQTFQQIWEVL